MRNLIKIVLLGCVVFFADNSFAISPDIEAGDSNVPAAVAADCTETNLWDCFDPDTYTTPRQVSSADSSEWCKTWSTSGFTCSGTYTMAVYPLVGIVSHFIVTTTCSGGVNATTQNGQQIEQILTNYSASQLTQLSAEEVRNHEGVVMVKGTFSGGETGSVSIETYCGAFTNASAANDASSGSDVDPVNTYTGELFDSYPPDLNLGGPMPLFFSRYYASGLRTDGITDDMGDNWLHNFEWTMAISGTDATITSNKGRNITFSNNGTSWDLTGKTDIPFQLVTSGSYYVLYVPGTERLYTFDSTGTLTTIENRRGNTHTLTYSGSDITQVTDELGRTLTFTYNSNTKLSNISDGTRSVTFGYTNNNLTSITDARGNVTQHTYDMGGLMTATTRSAGNTPYTQTYNTDGTVATQTDALNNTTTLSYNSSTGVTSMVDSLSNSRSHTHSSNGEITANQRQDGSSTSVGYDSTGRRNTVTDLLGDTTTYTYHTASGKLASVTNADTTVTAYTYTSRAHSSGVVFYDRTGITYPDATTAAFVYDTSGNMTSRTDRAAQVWSFTYNSSGQVLTATNPLTGVTTNTYNADGTLSTRADNTGNTTTYAYDSLGRLVTITHDDATTRAFTYDNNNNLLTNTDERSNITTFTYDNNNNLATITDPLSKTITFAYDNMDRISSVTDPLSSASSRTYDELGRLKTTTDRNGNITTFAYDSRGRLTSITDGGSNVWSRTYDAESIIASTTNPLSNTTGFISDKMGRITQTTNPLSNATNVTYDSMGRATTIQNPLNETTTYSFDARGLISGISIPGGISASYTKNALGLITAVTDPNGNAWNRVYDAQGRRTSRTDPLGEATSYSYDNRSRISQVTLPGSLGTQTITYDGTSNVTDRLYSDSTNLSYTFDNNGRLTVADGVSLAYDDNGRITTSNGIAITRNTGGRIETITLAAGDITYAYDSRDLLTSVTDWLAGVTTFTYDVAGQLATITRPNGVTSTYTYDNNGRMATLQEGSLSSISLTRDGKGQITAAARTLPLEPTITTSTKTLTYDAAHQVASYTYDAMGSLTNDGTRTYTWDLASRLTDYTEGSTISFTYDGMGNRLTRTESGTTNSYVWNYAFGLPSIPVEKQGGSDLRYYVHTPGGSLLYSIEATGSARKDYHYDEMGNTIFLTDSTGTVIASYAYSPYGTLLASTGSEINPFTWQGKFGVMQEGTSGLYYMRARYYDSGSKRFISRDPVKSIGPRSINPYQYAMGNPMRYVDPSGRKTIEELEAAYYNTHTDAAHAAYAAGLDKARALANSKKTIEELEAAYYNTHTDAAHAAYAAALDKARPLSFLANMLAGNRNTNPNNSPQDRAPTGNVFSEELFYVDVKPFPIVVNLPENDHTLQSGSKLIIMDDDTAGTIVLDIPITTQEYMEEDPFDLDLVVITDDQTWFDPRLGESSNVTIPIELIRLELGNVSDPDNGCGSVVDDLQGIVTLC